MISTTIRIDPDADADIDLVGLGARSGMLWRDQRVTLVGIGEAGRLVCERPNGSEAAQRALSEITGSDAVQRPGTGCVAFSAMAFDRKINADLVVPELLVGMAADGERWLTITQADTATESDVGTAMGRVRSLSQRPVPDGPDPTTIEVRSVLEPSEWQAIVASAIDQIKTGELNKAVLAREILVTTDRALDPALIMQRLARTHPTAILFQVDGFLGASPELLAHRSGDVVSAHPLAGTAPRGADPASDAQLAAELLASTKNQWEHRITIEWLLNTLLPFCSYVDAEPEPSIVTLPNVHHLGTRVEGRLSSPPASILDLVAALHPTPAVGGDPQEAALVLIDQIEKAERGLYAGPVGWVDGAGNGAFAVGIRSATHHSECEYRVFSGVGVVADSDPEAELAETRSKLQAMLGAFIQP